jgi:hypothetical protein
MIIFKIYTNETIIAIKIAESDNGKLGNNRLKLGVSPVVLKYCEISRLIKT